MTPEQKEFLAYYDNDNLIEEHEAFKVRTKLIDIIREQEEEIEAVTGMLAKMHDKNFDLEAEIKSLHEKLDLYRYDLANAEDKQNSQQGWNVELQKENKQLRERLKPIGEVFERLKHIDKFLSDRTQVNLSLYDCWQAIKASCEGKVKI